ncbi:hypothetical protein MHLP_01795 [Candidatus Mycoplasma haematolamae str. Purdue]|uniref:Uncharacterized protein n=1 Tax=Mycoplasma haematolamae (strain Purdue) TaxID=1212765 RepID=I7CJD2_MYCHA|nr:hypothetical protein [Candidatus Mycoplasma haematolamae]AFO51939.1 hypothetical protein MHLP_01795 [Candidatus Mycoplasma haematolamae str. Purdue]
MTFLRGAAYLLGGTLGIGGITTTSVIFTQPQEVSFKFFGGKSDSVSVPLICPLELGNEVYPELTADSDRSGKIECKKGKTQESDPKKLRMNTGSHSTGEISKLSCTKASEDSNQYNCTLLNGKSFWFEKGNDDYSELKVHIDQQAR